MIAADDLDLDAFGSGVEVCDRELRRRDRAGATDVGIKARHVAQDADFDDAIGILRKGGAARQKRRHHDHVACRFHSFPPCRAGGPCSDLMRSPKPGFIAGGAAFTSPRLPSGRLRPSSTGHGEVGICALFAQIPGEEVSASLSPWRGPLTPTLSPQAAASGEREKRCGAKCDPYS